MCHVALFATDDTDIQLQQYKKKPYYTIALDFLSIATISMEMHVFLRDSYFTALYIHRAFMKKKSI